MIYMPFNLNTSSSKTFLEEAHIHRPIDLHIGKRLKKRREEVGFCCKHLAQETMLDEATIHSFENGSARIGSRDLLNISEALDTNISYFYAG